MKKKWRENSKMLMSNPKGVTVTQQQNVVVVSNCLQKSLSLLQSIFVCMSGSMYWGLENGRRVLDEIIFILLVGRDDVVHTCYFVASVE